MYQLAKFSRLMAKRAIPYNGPASVVSGATAWWGLRAYSQGSVGANAVRLRRSTDNAEQTFTTVSGGGLDLAAISSFKGAGNLFVTILYDQIGSHTLSQGSAGSQPPFILAALGSYPVFRFTATGEFLDGPGALGTTQPLTHLLTVKRTGGTGIGILGASGGQTYSGFDTSTDTARMYAGSGITAAAVNNSFHAIHAVCNGASSGLYINASATSGDAGTNGFSSTTRINHNFAFQGDVTEMGVWPSAFSGTQSTNMNANQHNYWGF